jgi:hypothetical protein
MMLRVMNLLYVVFATVISVYLMMWFENITYDELDSFTADGVMSSITSGFIDPWTVLYSVVLSIIDTINHYVVHWFIVKRNYRFKKDYNDSLHLQSFVFSFIGFFLPLGYVAFIRQSFFALFTMMFVTLIFENIKAMIMRVIP